MIYLNRLGLRLEVAAKGKRGRRSVVDKIAPEDGGKQKPKKVSDPAGDEKTQEQKTKTSNPNEEQKQKQNTKTQPQNTKAPPAQQEGEPQSKGISTGYGKVTPGRLSEILSMDPYLFVVVAAPSELPNLVTFLKNSQNIVNNPNLSHRLLGPTTVTDKQNKEIILAYLVGAREINELKNNATNVKLPITGLDFSRQLRTSRPFEALKLDSDLAKRFSSGDFGTKLRHDLQASFEAMKKSNQTEKGEEGDSSGEDYQELNEVSALQMSRSIPVDYMRFLSKQHATREFYVGGTPDNAGRDGMRYALCTREQSSLFMKTMKEFRPASQFGDDLYFLNNIDSEFKTTEPRDVDPANCLIFESKTKFEPNEDTIDKLTGFINKLCKRTTQGGRYVNGTHVKGTRFVHFSSDFKRAILWGSHAPLGLDPTEKKQMIDAFDLKDIDTTFSK